MKKFRKIIHKLLFPPLRVILLVSLIGFPLMIISLGFFSETSPVSYVSYLLAAYATTVLCANFSKMKRRLKELIHGDEVRAIVSFRSLMHRYKYTGLYLDSAEFRARVSLYSGLAINLFYAVFKCATGAIFRSAWLWAIGIYYVMLSAIRFTLLKNVRMTDKKTHSGEKKLHEYKSARLCGVMMLALNLAMTGMTIQMIWRNRGYEYKGYMIYISALYAFYCFIHAIVNVVKFSKIDNPILSSAKIISLAGALMSMFALQTAMFSAFGGGAWFQRLMNTVTGGVVCTAVLGMAIFLIMWSQRNVKKSERSASDGRNTKI